MSNLKEPIVITFLATNFSANDNILVYPSAHTFRFNGDFYGSYGYITGTPAADIRYYVRNETQNTVIGSIDILTTKEFVFNTEYSASVGVLAGDIITIASPAAMSPAYRFGISLVGER